MYSYSIQIKYVWEDANDFISWCEIPLILFRFFVFNSHGARSQDSAAYLVIQQVTYLSTLALVIKNTQQMMQPCINPLNSLNSVPLCTQVCIGWGISRLLEASLSDKHTRWEAVLFALFSVLKASTVLPKTTSYNTHSFNAHLPATNSSFFHFRALCSAAMSFPPSHSHIYMHTCFQSPA